MDAIADGLRQSQKLKGPFSRGWCAVPCDSMLPDKQLKTFHSQVKISMCVSSWAFFFSSPNRSLVKHRSDLYVLGLNSKTYLLLANQGNYCSLFDVEDLGLGLRAKS